MLSKLKFMIDGSESRIQVRMSQWAEGVCGQLLTPLTLYRLCTNIFAIDNGAFSGFNETRFVSLLKRYQAQSERCLFVAIPDKVDCHKTTMDMWTRYHEMANGYNKAFVIQDGWDGTIPDNSNAIFIGGTTEFKDGPLPPIAIELAHTLGLHVHIGRINESVRFLHFRALGAHTCDDSGVSRYDHMLPRIRDAVECYPN